MRGATPKISAVVLSVGVALSTVPPVAAQQDPSARAGSRFQQTAAASHGKSRAHRLGSVRYVAPQPQIACTVVGCNPVPPGCHPEPQRYFSGMTTGFDAVVCP
jgi:hypothetical protein